MPMIFAALNDVQALVPRLVPKIQQGLLAKGLPAATVHRV